VGTTDGALKQIAVGFTERPENLSFISHMLFPISIFLGHPLLEILPFVSG
jgi:hypothetical protein